MNNLSQKIFIFLFYLSTCCFGQSQIKLNTTDSTLLMKTWGGFIENFKNKKTTEIKNNSLSKIDCIRCYNYDQFVQNKSDDFTVPIDSFIKHFYHFIPKSKLWTIITSSKPSITIRKYKKLIIYEIWFLTFRPNEIAKGHEGGQDIFEFIKAGNKFKLYGFSSVP